MKPPPDRTFTIDQSFQEVHGRVFDPDWVEVDRAGHRHHCAPSADGRKADYPTLARLTERVDCPDPEGCGCDGWDDDYYVCKECGQRITPGTRPGVFLLPGRLAYAIDGRPVTAAVYEAESARHLALQRQYLDWQAAQKPQ